MTQDLFSKKYDVILSKLSSLHNLTDMPFPKTPFVIEMLSRMMKDVYSTEGGTWNFDYRDETTWYLGILEKLSPHLMTAFCHNDVNMNNILIPKDANMEDVSASTCMLIDYEYSGYNFAAFDFANYFCEMQYDWSIKSEPYFVYNDDWFPKDSKIIDMIEFYRTKIDDNTRIPDNETFIKHIKIMSLGSELLWGVWCQSFGKEGNNVDIGDYEERKRKSYFNKKERFWSIFVDLGLE